MKKKEKPNHAETRRQHIVHILKRGHLVTLPQLMALYREEYSTGVKIPVIEIMRAHVDALVLAERIHLATFVIEAPRYFWKGEIVIDPVVTQHVVDAMVPGIALPTDEIGERYERNVGTRLTRDALNTILSHLHHQHDASGARLMQHNSDESWTRPILVGMGATICGWTDRHAATVIAVSKTGHKVTVQEDKATRIDANGMSDQQSYSYAPDPSGKVKEFYRDDKGRYGGGRLVLGHRRSYYDYGF